MSLKRQELIERLKKLAQSEPPKCSEVIAMCYSQGVPEPLPLILCPVCLGAKFPVCKDEEKFSPEELLEICKEYQQYYLVF